MSSISSIANAVSVETQIAVLPQTSAADVVSLEDRLIQNFAGSAVGIERDYNAINAMLMRPDITNPEVLAQLQIRMADYNIDVNLLNTLVRKTVATAETLLRSS